MRASFEVCRSQVQTDNTRFKLHQAVSLTLQGMLRRNGGDMIHLVLYCWLAVLSDAASKQAASKSNPSY